MNYLALEASILNFVLWLSFGNWACRKPMSCVVVCRHVPSLTAATLTSGNERPGRVSATDPGKHCRSSGVNFKKQKQAGHECTCKSEGGGRDGGRCGWPVGRGQTLTGTGLIPSKGLWFQGLGLKNSCLVSMTGYIQIVDQVYTDIIYKRQCAA